MLRFDLCMPKTINHGFEPSQITGNEHEFKFNQNCARNVSLCEGPWLIIKASNPVALAHRHLLLYGFLHLFIMRV